MSAMERAVYPQEGTEFAYECIWLPFSEILLAHQVINDTHEHKAPSDQKQVVENSCTVAEQQARIRMILK